MTPSILTRKELRDILGQWREGNISAVEIQAWSEHRFATDDWDVEDDIANEVLGNLDQLDMNLLTADDVPVLLRVLELPASAIEQAVQLHSEHLQSVDMRQRAESLMNDPLYSWSAKLYLEAHT